MGVIPSVTKSADYPRQCCRPPLQPIPGTSAQGFVDTSVVEKLWLEQFDFAYREYDSFVFPMSIHPQVSGKPGVILMHER